MHTRLAELRNPPNKDGTPKRKSDKDYKSQQDLADYLGCTRRSYNGYEAGSENIPVDFLIKLSTLYQVSTDYILELTEYRNIGNDHVSSITGLSDKSIEVLRFLNSAILDSEDNAEHKKTIDFINIALEDIWDQIKLYRSDPENHAPVTAVFYTMMQYLISDSSELCYRYDGEEFEIPIERVELKIHGESAIYKVSEMSREMIVNRLKKWLEYKRKEIENNGFNKNEGD